jgi:small GTP-binding protein
MSLDAYKIVVVGASGAGKTSLLHRLLDENFNSELPSTVGVEFISYRCEVDGRQTKLQIWDTAGQERFRAVTRSYLRGAIGALLVFDLTSPPSFQAVADWHRDIVDLCHSNAVVLLVANKFDLVERRAIARDKCQELADSHRLDLIETSAVTGLNVKESFLRVAHEIFVRQQNGTLVIQTIIERPILAEEEARGCKC